LTASRGPSGSRSPRSSSTCESRSTPKRSASFWAQLLPGQIPDRLVVAEPLTDGGFELEGHDLVALDLGHTDTDDTTCLHVPDIDLVVAGDAVYNDVHLYLAESDPDRRKAWIAAIDRIEALRPRAVISGHKRAGRADDPHTSKRPASTSAISTALTPPPPMHAICTTR